MKELFRFFLGNRPKSNDDLAPPVSIRIPQKLLDEIDVQSKEIGGERYRSKHFISLLEVGVQYFCARIDHLKTLPIAQFELHLRLNFVFYKLGLNPSVVAQDWGHENVNQWTAWLEGKETPSFEVIERFAEKYFLDAEWLKHGPEFDQDKYALHSVQHLPNNCYENFYTFAHYLYNLRREDVEKIRIIRSKSSGEILIDVGYGNKNSISVFCPKFKLLDVDAIENTELFYLRTFTLFCALYQKNEMLLPSTFSINDSYFNLIKSGEETFDRINFWAEDASQFNSSERWSNILYDLPMIKTMDEDRIWAGGKQLLLKMYECEKSTETLVAEIKKALQMEKIADCYFKQGIELFKGFNGSLGGAKKKITVLDIPFYGECEENCLISGSIESGFTYFALKAVNHKVKCGEGLIYINATGCEDDLVFIKDTLKCNNRKDDLFIPTIYDVAALHSAIQNRKVIYIALDPNKPMEEEKKNLKDFFKAFVETLSLEYYFGSNQTLVMFTNECVDYLDENIGRFYEGSKWFGFKMYHSNRMSLEAKLADPASLNKVVYEILVGNSQNRIIYNPTSEKEETLLNEYYDSLANQPLGSLGRNEFAVLNSARKLKYCRIGSFTYLTKQKQSRLA